MREVFLPLDYIHFKKKPRWIIKTGITKQLSIGFSDKSKYSSLSNHIVVIREQFNLVLTLLVKYNLATFSSYS